MTIFTYYTGNSRESYLNWTRQWKAEYKSLSEMIRNLKQSRKQFTWQYRAKGDTISKRKTKVGENPNYNRHNAGSLWMLRNRANYLLELRKQAKQEAARQYLARMNDIILA